MPTMLSLFQQQLVCSHHTCLIARMLQCLLTGVARATRVMRRLHLLRLMSLCRCSCSSLLFRNPSMIVGVTGREQALARHDRMRRTRMRLWVRMSRMGLHIRALRVMRRSMRSVMSLRQRMLNDLVVHHLAVGTVEQHAFLGHAGTATAHGRGRAY